MWIANQNMPTGKQDMVPGHIMQKIFSRLKCKNNFASIMLRFHPISVAEYPNYKCLCFSPGT